MELRSVSLPSNFYDRVSLRDQMSCAFIQRDGSIANCRYFPVGEKHGKTGAASPRLRAAAYSNPASMFIDNPTGDPQTKTRTLLPFCGEEWLKHSSPVLTRNAGSVVCNENTDSTPFWVSPVSRGQNVHLERSLRSQGFQRIDYKIGEYLGYLAGKAMN